MVLDDQSDPPAVSAAMSNSTVFHEVRDEGAATPL